MSLRTDPVSWTARGGAAIVVAAVVASLQAQAPAADRIIETAGRWSADEPVLDLVLAVARGARVPMLLETAPIQERTSTGRVELRGKTVRAALDALVAADGRYEWEERAGVLVIRPRDQRTDPRNPLNEVVPPVAWRDVTAKEVVGRVSRLIYRQPESALQPGPENRLDSGDRRTFDVITVRPTAILEVVVAAARAHGELIWSFPYDEDDPLLELGGYAFGFRTFDPRVGFGSYTPVMPPSLR